MLDTPLIVPGPDAHDAGGVEDPTVLRRQDGSYVVYYTGVAPTWRMANCPMPPGPRSTA